MPSTGQRGVGKQQIYSDEGLRLKHIAINTVNSRDSIAKHGRVGKQRHCSQQRTPSARTLGDLMSNNVYDKEPG